MRLTKNSHNFTLFHTLLHYRNYHTLRSGAYTQLSPQHVISISHFFASTEPLSKPFPRAAAGFLTFCHSTHAYTYTYSEYTYTLTLYSAAGPICLLRYKALNTHMDHRLLSLAVSILLAVIWYVIYV